MGTVVFHKKTIFAVSLLVIIIVGFLLWMFFSGFFKPYAEEKRKLVEISTEITALTSPSNPDISPEVFKLQQAEISDIVKQVNALLEKGDVINAQIQLADLQNKIQHVGNLYKGTFVQKAEKDKHDPEGKYLPKNLSIDPAVLPWYWTVTDIRVKLGNKR